MAEDITVADASRVLDLMAAFRRSKTMFAAVELGIFDALELAPLSADAIAEKLHLNGGAVKRLLDALVGLGLLVRRDRLYENTDEANTYLCSSSPRRLTGYILYSNDVMWKMWANLEGAIREGTHRWYETYGWNEPIFANFFRDDHAMREFLMGMHGFGVLSSPHVVNAFDLSCFSKLVDLGGATGHLTIAACQRYQHLQGEVFDLPQATPLAREIIELSGLSDRIAVTGGDFFHDALPSADLYALGRILHDWSAEKNAILLRRIYDALPIGGGLLIAEKMLSEDGTGPSWAQMQCLNMLIVTEGQERTLTQYDEILTAAGFVEIQGCRTAAPIDAILARKR